jgi:hypothetical protein
MRIALTVAGALLVGALAGFAVARAAEPQPELASELISCEVASTGQTPMVLRVLRGGNADKIALLLESHLSLNAVILDEWLDHLPSADPAAPERTLRGVAKHRSVHPFESGNAESDRIVAAVLAKYTPK